ncbi:CAP domain [Plasmopara halstedii]|uniref:CAP domain n=1 Tax=Plasmopara halstedii TaxID=4781 RepID=A0A0P1AE25_PLAHL|nr:CAP domain [Plasmopara halstedii]CEG38769.1 CAP domain [Plasmopara halstedii]|eukprot:XP_024575138.1 CAP domain [Plasmopara halstedii]
MTLLGNTTLADVNMGASSQLSLQLLPIIGDALYEDIDLSVSTANLPNNVNNITNAGNFSRNLQAVSSSDGIQADLLKAVNRERAAYKLPPLCLNIKLKEAAQGHSNDMAFKNYMSHQGSDGSTMSQRLQEKHYDSTAAGENVAAGHNSVDKVMEAWMNSPGHRANILREKFTMFGCGYAYDSNSMYKIYWTQNFGKSQTEKCS